MNYKIKSSSNLRLIPNIGLRYSGFFEDAYNETGAGVYNLEIGAKSGSGLTAIAGINVISPYNLSDSLTIIPSIQCQCQLKVYQ